MNLRFTILARHNQKTIVMGKPSIVQGTLFTIQGNLQPINGKDVEVITEYKRDTGIVYEMFTSSDTILNLNTSDNPDYILIDNVEFDVIHAELWKNNLIDHRVYFIQEILNA